MTLTLEVPPLAEGKEQQEKRVKAAVFMYDAQIVSEGQAADIAGLPLAEFLAELRSAKVPVLPSTAEEVAIKKASAGAGQLTAREARIQRFEQWAESNSRNTPLLSDKAISRETIYGSKK